MRKFAALLLCLTLLLTGCQTPTPPEELPPEPVPDTSAPLRPEEIPFRLAVYDRTSLHPILSDNRTNLALAPLVYESLFALNENFEAQRVLCAGASVNETGLVWTLTLVPGVTFSDGTPLTGTIAAAALNTARSPASRFSSRLREVTAVTGTADTVTITLSAPNGSLPALLDIPIPLDNSDRPLGTGQYVLTQSGEELALTARPDWRLGETAPIQSIPLKRVSRSDELILSFESGDVALVDVDLMGTNALGYSGSYETWDYTTTALLYLGFNTKSGLCRDVRVRQALALSVDRESIAQVDFARHAVPSALPIHPDSPLYSDSAAAPLAYDPEELMTRLSELRVTNRTLTLLVNSENSPRVAAAQRIAEQLRRTGLEIRLEKLSFEDYLLALEAGNFDLYLGEVVLTADFDPSSLLLKNGALNYGRWEHEDFPSLLAQYRTGLGAELTVNARLLWGLLAEQVPIAPICFKNGCVLTRWGRLSGLEPVRGNVFYHLDRWTII